MKERMEMTKCNTCGGTTVFVSSGIVKCEYCGRLYSTSNGEMNLADPERLYSSAVNMAKSRNEETLKSAIETFEALGNYKDSSALANSCRGMIAQSRVEAEERRLAAERQAEVERIESEKRTFEERQKAKVRGIVIAAVSVVAVIAVAISVISNSNKSASYDKAMELYSMGQYEEARAVFEDLGDYSDAASYVSTIDNLLTDRENKYEKGVSYYEKGAYSECIASLADISGYLDAESYIEKSVEAIYQQATEYYSASDFEKAKELLEKIPDSSSKSMDAELLLADIEEIIIEQTNAANYEQARGCYDSGDYETAQRLFMSLGNYEDSATYLSAIGTSYYNYAMDLFNQKQYVQCGDVLKYIDTAEEWSGYNQATELRKNAADAYKVDVEIEAKKISRNEGYLSMSEFVSGKVGGIFTQEMADMVIENSKIEVISFKELEPCATEGDGIYESTSEERCTDTYGNVYQFVLCTSGAPNIERSATYYIDQKYTYLTGTVGLQTAGSRNGFIKIYGDGVLLWADELIDEYVIPYKIEVNVTGIEMLKIEMSGGERTRVILGDPMLSE